MKYPWFKFYPTAWRSDPGLRLCSLAARGLWIEMISYMHESTPYGHLIVAGGTPDEREISKLVGVSVQKVTRFCSELERNGVFSRTQNGTIFSRRMVDDYAKAQRDSQNGRKGGNPQVKGGVNPEVKGGDKAKILDTRSKKKESKGGADAPGLFYSGSVIKLRRDQFDRWAKGYRHIPDLTAALEKADAYYSENPPPGGRWFFPVARWLEQENGRWIDAGGQPIDIRSF
jgi:hypothetical protein